MNAWLDRPIQFKSIFKTIKGFFHRQSWKETLIFLFFILLALGFWVLQNLQQEYEIEILFPVKYTNLPEEMRSTDDFPQEIAAKVRDKGLILINYTWLRFFNPVEVNLADIRKEGSIQVSRRTIEAGIAKQILSSTSLLNIEPQTITVDYTEFQHNDVPVEVDIAVSPEPGFQLSGSMIVTPDKVRLFADRSKLDSVTSVKTVFTDLRKIKQTIELKIRLQKIAGVQMEPAEVTVTVPVEEFTEKKIILAVTCNDLPAGYTLRTFPSSVEVVCNVPISRFRELSDNDIEIQIPFHEFELRQNDGKIPLYLTKQPLWAIRPVIIPETIEFIIEQNSQ